MIDKDFHFRRASIEDFIKEIEKLSLKKAALSSDILAKILNQNTYIFLHVLYISSLTDEVIEVTFYSF